MSVGLLLITHNRIGAEFLATATRMLGGCPLTARCLAISDDCDPEAARQRARSLMGEIDQGSGVLVLTDLYGGTPSNIAVSLCARRVRVVAGLSLPMLVRVLNYPSLGLSAMADKAESGAHAGIYAVPMPGDARAW